MLAFAPIDSGADLAYTAVAGLADLLAPVVGGSATAAAIVVVTVLVRLLISPLSWAQSKGQRRQAALTSKIRDLQQRHAGDQDRLRAELLALYRSEGTAPLAGCLPALAQAPIVLVVFRLFTSKTVNGHDNDLLGHGLFGVPLGHQLSDGLGGAAGAVFLVLFAALTLLAWQSSRRFRAAGQPGGPDKKAATPAPPTGGAAVSSGGGAAVSSGGGAAVSSGGGAAVPLDGVAPAMNRVLALLPYLMILTAALVPLAAGLYLLTTTAWTAVEQSVLRRVAGDDHRPRAAAGTT